MKLSPLPGKHTQGMPKDKTSVWLAPLLVLVLAMLAIGGWFVARHFLDGNAQTGGLRAIGSPGLRAGAKTGAAVPTPATPVAHHGNSPDCPDTDCIAVMVNGDLLFHEGLWNNFAKNSQATDGSAFDFTPLFAPMSPYIKASDISVCEFETPIAQRGGPYAAYPVFNIPPEVADAAAKVGYNACTHASNHSWDQGAAGIARLTATLQSDGIAQTGSYTSEQDSMKPLVVPSPTGGGSVGIVAGTVSLNGQVRQRIGDVIYAMGADRNIVREWLITKETRP